VFKETLKESQGLSCPLQTSLEQKETRLFRLSSG